MPTPNSPDTPKHKESLPRRAVLRRRSEFEKLFEGGKRIGNKFLTFILLPNISSETAKVAFVTPKRLGDAVVRNKLRRRLREVYRRTFPHLAPKLNFDLVVLAKTESLGLDFAALKKSFLELHARVFEIHNR